MKNPVYQLLSRFISLFFFFSFVFGGMFYFLPSKSTQAQGIISSDSFSSNEVEVASMDISKIPKLKIVYAQSEHRMVRVYLADGKSYLVPETFKHFLKIHPSLLPARKSSAGGSATKTYFNRHYACYNRGSQTVYLRQLGKRISVSDSCKTLAELTVKKCP